MVCTGDCWAITAQRPLSLPPLCQPRLAPWCLTLLRPNRSVSPPFPLLPPIPATTRTTFTLDALSAFPLDLVVLACAGLQHSSSSTARYICLLGFLRLLGLYRLGLALRGLATGQLRRGPGRRLRRIGVMVLRNLVVSFPGGAWGPGVGFAKVVLPS